MMPIGRIVKMFQRSLLKGLLTVVSFFLLLTVSCDSKESQNVSEPDFIALAQQHDSYRKRTTPFLIRTAHQSVAYVNYGFSDNAYCSGQFKDREKQLTSMVRQSFSVWMQPIVDSQDFDVVSHLTFTSRNAVIDKDFKSFKDDVSNYYKLLIPNSNYHYDEEGRRRFGGGVAHSENSPDLKIVFYCTTGRSFANIDNMTIHMYQEEGRRKLGWMTDRERFSLMTLHHEMGHMFGLGDTYIEPDKDDYWRYNTSDGGSTKTVGLQPISVMNTSFEGLRHDGTLRLGGDDYAGVLWLYDYHVARTVDIKDCPRDYLFKESTQGCAPRYPLISAVMSNNWSEIIDIVKHDSSAIDEQDSPLGNSALHYAALQIPIHGDYIFIFLTKEGGNINLKNTSGKTPSDIFESWKH